MQERSRKTGRGTSRGESMIFAVLLLLVFLSIGVSVMTAGAGAASTVSARASERQCYYLARSVLDALDTSLQSGEIGRSLRQGVLNEAIGASTGRVAVNKTVPLSVSSGAAALAGMEVTNAQLALTGAGSVIARNTNGDAAQALVSFDRAELRFTVTWNGKSYDVRTAYSYAGWANADAAAAGGWRWNGAWSVLAFE